MAKATGSPPGFAYPVAMRADPIERVLRGLYSAALYLLLPVTVYHLIWRSFRQGEYLQRWNERYAVYGTARATTPPFGCMRYRWER